MTAAEPHADPYVCEHCDDSVPHTHVDEEPLVEGYRRGLLVSAILGLAAIPIAVLLFANVVGFMVVLAVAAWALCTAIGVVTAAVLARRVSTPRAVLTGALVSAAIAPLTAFSVVALAQASTGGATPWVCVVAATSGWLVGGGTALAVRGLRLRQLLVAHTREGEAARGAVVRSNGEPSPMIELGWAAMTALWFGVCAGLLAMMPISAFVLVPLSVALAVLSRRWQAQAAATA